MKKREFLSKIFGNLDFFSLQEWTPNSLKNDLIIASME